MGELRRRVRGAHADSGSSLIEMLVVMIIFTGILAVTYSVLATVTAQTIDTVAKSDDASQARLGLAQIDRLVRSGNVLYSPAAEVGTTGCTATTPSSGNCMRAYTQSNGAQRCVQWQVLNGRLRSRSWTTSWQTDGLVSPWVTKASNIVNPANQPPFTLQGSSTSYGSRLMDVSLQVKSPKANGAPTKVGSSLSGRNTNYGYDPGVCSPVPPA